MKFIESTTHFEDEKEFYNIEIALKIKKKDKYTLIDFGKFGFVEVRETPQQIFDLIDGKEITLKEPEEPVVGCYDCVYRRSDKTCYKDKKMINGKCDDFLEKDIPF